LIKKGLGSFHSSSLVYILEMRKVAPHLGMEIKCVANCRVQFRSFWGTGCDGGLRQRTLCCRIIF